MSETKKTKKSLILFAATSLVLLVLIFLYFRDTFGNGTFHGSFAVIGIILLAAFAAAFFMALFKVNKRIIMTALLVVFACLFSAATPIGQMHDEEIHFYRSYEISQGDFLCSLVGENNVGGDYLPSGIRDFKDTDAVLDYDNTEVVEFPTAAIYSPCAYAPQAVGMALARIFTNRVSYIFLAGRLAVLLVCLALCIWAIWAMPFGCEIMFMIMMFPMTLQELGTLSTDGVMISISLCFVAQVLRLSYGGITAKTRHIIMLVLLGMWLSIVKIFYFPIVLLVFMIPFTTFGSKLKSRIVKIAVLASSCTFVLSWMLMTIPYLGSGQRGDIYGQAGFMITHLPKFVSAVIRTYFEKFSFYVGSMIGVKLGALNIDVSSIVWTMFLILFVYIAATNCSMKAAPRKWDCVLYIAAAFLSMALIFTGLYLQWTADVGSAVVEGVQGRYFTPVMLPIALLWTYYNRRKNFNFSSDRRYYYVLIAFLDVIAALAVLRISL